MISVALYTRVSTLHQVEEGFSLETQKDTLIKYAKNNNYKIYKIYEEQGRSGKDTNRPMFQEMMTDMKEGKFQKIVVMKLDRISRSVSDLENIIKEIQKYDCGFESASEKIDTTSAMGLMFTRLLGIFAQFERERISERIRDVFAEKVEKGQAVTGSVPFGYILGTNSNGITVVVKDKEKEEVVNALFDTYEKTSSLWKTSQYLNKKYPDLTYKNGFSSTDVKRIMANPMYYGNYRNNYNYCEPYLTYERWKKINELRKDKNIKSNKRYTYMFSSIIKGTCGHTMCGYKYKITNKNGSSDRFAYRCAVYARSNQCKNYNILEEIIEQKVIEMLPKVINKFIADYEKEYSKISKNDNSKIIKSLENERKRIVNSYNKGWLSEKDTEKEIDKIDKELKKYSKVEPKKDYSALKEIENLDWLSMYKEFSREEKQLFFRSFIDYIVVDVDGYRKGKENFIKIKLLD